MFLWRLSLGNNETSSSSLQAFECLSLRVLLMDQCDTITNQMHLNADNVESAARNRGQGCLVQAGRRRSSSVFVINLIEASPCGFVRHSVRSVCRCTLAQCCWLQDAEQEIRTVWSFLSCRNFADGQRKSHAKQQMHPECTQPILLFDCRHERHCRTVLSVTSEGLICTDQDTKTWAEPHQSSWPGSWGAFEPHCLCSSFTFFFFCSLRGDLSPSLLQIMTTRSAQSCFRFQLIYFYEVLVS